ncbi:MAG: ABC transporter permease [Cyanobacteriota bacterium]
MTSASPGLNALPADNGAASALAEILQETLALTRRLFVQLLRRPSTLIAGVLQPLIWLLLFGALFAKAPSGFLPGGESYGRFFGAGVIGFTAVSAALNAGLPVMFDREFGFLNRLLVAPLRSRSSIIFSSVLYISTLSLIQSLAIIFAAALLGYGWPGPVGLLVVLLTLALLVFAVTALSLGLAFALPGHIEMIAVIFVVNLPLLFASTALAPLSFMPPWLAWLAAVNPLTFAIEPIRALYNGHGHLSDVVLQAPYGALSGWTCLWLLFALAFALFLLVRPLLDRKLQ